MTARLVVLASGGGTNCQALIDACHNGTLAAGVVAVITNKSDAGVLQRSIKANIPTQIVAHESRDDEGRRADDARLIAEIAAFEPDLVVLAGWMRILGREVGSRFKMINLHPARPGELAGTHAIERAFAEWQQGERSSSGVMVHWVPDEGVDEGPVIVADDVPFVAGDTVDSFAERMHVAEHRLIVDGVAQALTGA